MKRRAPSALTFMGLAAASWETMARRSLMMATGTCSPAEYQRMVTEKAQANWDASMALMMGGSGNAVMAPYLKAARANAKRLRKS